MEADVTAANITVTGVTSSQSITTTGSVSNEPLHTVTIDPLSSGVGNSPSPNNFSDTATHTVAFTTADALPADGKIVVTFPANFDLASVGDSDISSGTMDGTFTVSTSGQELTITRSGGGSPVRGRRKYHYCRHHQHRHRRHELYRHRRDPTSGSITINGPTVSSTFAIAGKSTLADPDTQVTDQLGITSATQPTDVALVGFKITRTGENLTWTDLVVSLTYGGGMADADITNAEIYVDNGTVGTYDSGVDTKVGSQTVSASGDALTWDNVAGTITAATNYLIIFDAGASLNASETVQASVTAGNITVTGVTSSQSITTSGDVTNEPLHTVTATQLTERQQLAQPQHGQRHRNPYGRLHHGRCPARRRQDRGHLPRQL